RLRER
ncbi:hypothetical protein MRX96_052840, partial [Rhipicephalus microplus]